MLLYKRKKEYLTRETSASVLCGLMIRVPEFQRGLGLGEDQAEREQQRRHLSETGLISANLRKYGLVLGGFFVLFFFLSV